MDIDRCWDELLHATKQMSPPFLALFSFLSNLCYSLCISRYGIRERGLLLAVAVTPSEWPPESSSAQNIQTTKRWHGKVNVVECARVSGHGVGGRSEAELIELDTRTNSFVDRHE